MKLRYNAPVTLTFALSSAAVLAADMALGGFLTRTFFTVYPDFHAANPLSWLRLFTHVIGHANWPHLIGNYSFILLIGPILEEKYGSGPLLLMILVTALVTGVLNSILVHAGLLGASGIVFMMILLSSFTNIKSGEIPITFLLVVALYLVKELVNALQPDQISQLAHIAGGVCGGLFGFAFREKSARGAPKDGKGGPAAADDGTIAGR